MGGEGGIPPSVTTVQPPSATRVYAEGKGRAAALAASAGTTAAMEYFIAMLMRAPPKQEVKANAID